MKKFAILALAALMVVALTVPATALENEFGGYWRTRFYNQGHFNGSRTSTTTCGWSIPGPTSTTPPKSTTI